MKELLDNLPFGVGEGVAVEREDDCFDGRPSLWSVKRENDGERAGRVKTLEVGVSVVLYQTPVNEKTTSDKKDRRNEEMKNFEKDTVDLLG